ncbi:expressed unknown protein [Seminavis robusta]|uniref:Uncharacterized protein n=1 Tax=Seminavis robusta TaxID=568900 RepID=A0A9N8E2G0_9STRA|nr:expressed unknown protein [Seminavis robusta]|eukprot:Sro582_g170440.1 n/a (283) ;mRNA; r:12215-13132
MSAPVAEEAIEDQEAVPRAPEDVEGVNEEVQPPEEDDGNEAPRVDESMVLTSQEREWARAIKTAIESCPDLDKLSDFEYCQLAIVDKGDVAASVDRATSLQGFRQEYDIQNTLEDALVALRNHVLLMPQSILSFCYSEAIGGYTLIADMGCCDLQLLKTEKGWKTHVAGLYYMLHAMSPDFQSIRTGITYVLEAAGFSLASNMDFKITKKECTEVYSVYPYTINKSITSRVQVGCIFPHGRLNLFYNIPDAQTAMERSIKRMQESVRRRYAMQAVFLKNGLQ